MFIKVVGLSALLFLVASCVDDRALIMNEEFGNSVRQNIALQTINPDAGGPDDSQILSGQQAQQAVELMLERPQAAETGSIIQDVGGGGGN
jgi:hypothetical protein